MRRVVFSFLLILFAFISHSQQTVLNDTIQFVKNHTNLIQSSTILNNHLYSCIGYVGNINQGLKVAKTDLYGNRIKEINFVDSFNHIFVYPYNTIVTTNDSNIALCYNFSSDTSSYIKSYIYKLNHNLDTLWSRVVTHPDTIAASQPGANVFSVLTAIKPTPDGGYILTGNYNKNCGSGGSKSFLLKIDSVGNVEWRKTYDDVAYVFNIEVVPWGGYTVLNSYGGRNIVLFDSLGNEIWRKKPNTNISLGATVDMSYDGNGAYIGSTTFKYTNSNGIDVYGINVFKIDFNSKQIIWDNKYKPFYKFYCLTLHQQLGVEALNNGDIIVSGTAYDGDHFGFILKLNSNGDSLWSKRYSFGPLGDDNCQINDLLVTDNNEFLGVGFYAPNSSNMAAWIFKTDSNGVLGIENKELGIRNEELRVFPNPANDFVNIEIDKPNLKLSYYKIFDSQGKLVLSNDFVSDRINVRSLSQGVYFIECDSEDGEVFSGKFFRN